MNRRVHVGSRKFGKGRCPSCKRVRHSMMVHALSASQRRLLVELLVSERSGERALLVGPVLGRDRTADDLSRLRMVEWVADDQIVFTSVGRHLAEDLVPRMVGRRAPVAWSG